MRRVGIIGISQETHGFFGKPTKKEDFVCHKGEEIISVERQTRTCIAGFIEGGEALGFTLVPGISFSAVPAGNIIEAEYQSLKKEFLEYVNGMLPLDGILVNMHGAMRSEQCPDCEGDILSALRSMAGKIPVVATLDLHANISAKMFQNADALVVYRRNPHTDKKERGIEAAGIMKRLLNGKRLHKSHIKLPLLLSPLTTRTDGYPLKAGNDVANKLRKAAETVSLSIAGGYFYSDSDIIGVSVLAYTDADTSTQQECDAMCHDMAEAVWKKRHTALYTGFGLEESVRKAIVTAKGPVMLADMGDNIGAGSPGDGTALLEKLVEYGAEKAAVVICDPEAVDLAYEIGEGGTALFRIGGKKDGCHGRTLELECVVERLTNGEYEVGGNSHFESRHGRIQYMGRCAVLRTGGVYILATEISTAPGGPEQLDSQGIPTGEMLIIGVKSVVAFRGGYEAIASEIFEVDTIGITTCDPFKLPIVSNKDKYYPLNANIEWS
jgi:microcystin degradation protein MlrC